MALALRPERIRLLPPGAAPPAENGVGGRLRELAYRGEAWLALVATAGGQELRVSLPSGGGAPPAPGSPVALAWAAESAVPLREGAGG